MLGRILWPDMAQVSEFTVEETLLEALQDARAKESARLEAVFNVQDLRTLRLMNLHDLIEPELAQNALAKPLFNLNLEPGEIPRLWLGLSSSIVMEPDPKTKGNYIFPPPENCFREYDQKYTAGYVHAELSALRSLH